jgi:pimeloyl-ACP methyl ester carboxylesterase
VIATEQLVHARARLALHCLRRNPRSADPVGSGDTNDGSDRSPGGGGRPLLLLHGLGERTPESVPPHLDGWRGPVYGLDFTGHGASTVPTGGGYTAEVLMADVDTALRHLGPVTVHGRGLGAYVGLLAAGARPDLVRGAILVDGPGLVGGGIRPGSPYVVTATDDTVPPGAPDGTAPPAAPDPYALAELSRDVRPPDYAMTYVRHALEYGELDTPFAVCTVVRPEWIEGIVGEPGVIDCTVVEAIELYDV